MSAELNNACANDQHRDRPRDHATEATVQLLNKQTTANATTQEIAATTQRVTTVARELASANSALSKALIS
jgi:hypothetical protein